MNNYVRTTDYYIDKYLNNNIEETIKTSLKDVELNNIDFLTYFRLGLACFFQENADVAIKYFDKSIELNNNFIHSYYFRGYAYLRIDVKKSIENFSNALEINPKDPLVLFYLGVSYEHSDVQKAIKYYTECINTDYEMAIDAYYWRAKCFYEINDYNSAIKDLNYVININPKYDDALILRGNSYIYGDIDIEKGLDDYETVVQVNIENYLLDALHQILGFSNDFERTLKNCNIAIDKNKTANADIYAFRSSIYNSLKEYNKALLDTEQALSKNNNNAYYLMNKAEAIIGLGNYDDAIKLLLKAIQIEPEHCGVLQVMASAYINKKDFEKALDCMDKSLSLCDCCSEHYIIRGYIKMQMGKYEDAIEDFNIIINSDFQTNPTNQELFSAYVNRSISNFELNKIDIAINDINKSIEFVNSETLKIYLIKLKESLQNKSNNIEDLYKKIVENYSK